MVKKNILLVKTGAINPYALVSSRKGVAIDWKNMSPVERKKLIEDELKLPFEKLFDPSNNSPLFYYPQNFPATGPDTEKAGEPSLRCTDSVQSWKPDDKGTFSSPPPDINEANQGCSLDCWFVAALASVAWAWPDYIKRQLPLNACYLKLAKGDPAIPNPPYLPEAGTDWKSIKMDPYKTSMALPWRSQTIGDWVFCHPCSDHPHVLWSGLFEKAYGNFWKLGGSGDDAPICGSFGTGNPLQALFHLTGKRYYTDLDQRNYPNHTRSAFYTSDFGAPENLFDTIYSACYAVVTGNPPPPYVPAMTKFPMVAMTYTTEDEANTANGVPKPDENPGKSVKYTNDSIVAQHSYSILGVHYDAGSGRKYIILRNPWGMPFLNSPRGDPVFVDPNPGTPFSAYYKEMNDALFTNLWKVPLNTGLGSTQIDMSKNDGIFALSADKFKWHFKCFGWVWNWATS
jgi:hypothetical protein